MSEPRWGEDKSESKFLARLQWTTSAGCSLHDAHNALKWGIDAYMGVDIVRNVYVVFKVLREGFDLIIKTLPKWLLRHTSFVPESQCPAVSDLEALWSTLGMDSDFVHTLAHDLKLHWNAESETLAVVDTWHGRSDAMAEIRGALMKIWHFKKFSDSR